MSDPAPASTWDERTDRRALHSHDIFVRGIEPQAIFSPASIEELAAGLCVAAKQGLAIVPRGGGMSYTGGYVANRADVLLVDMARMNRVIEINETDMTVTVEAGCTWHALYEALHPLGLRTPLWGTLSGLRAEIGGGTSQNGTFWGAARGSIAQSVLNYRVVLADGSIMETGSTFFRGFGPDITGLFGSDCGALGVKAHITLPLMREAEAFAYGSYMFAGPEAFCAVLSAIAREGLASELFGFDPYLQAQRMKRDSLAADAKSLISVMKSQGGFWRGLKEGARVVSAGRSFLDEAKFSLHCIAEGRTQTAADEDMRRIAEIAARHGAEQAENTIPKVLRANPFPPPNSMAGPDGSRWLPVHGIVRHSRAPAMLEALSALFETRRAEIERLAVGIGYLFATSGPTGFLIEPCFYWPDELWPLHEASIEPVHLAKLRRYPPNPEARALIEELRAGVIEVVTRLEGIHFQLGRTYPIRNRIDPAAWDLLKSLKARLDPANRMNPGVLGL
jgi:FAD/FMN-containing dehydrogenase